MERVYDYLGRNRLPSWLRVAIRTEGDSKFVAFLSSIHMNRRVELTFSFCAHSFTDGCILHDRDVMTKYCQLYPRG